MEKIQSYFILNKRQRNGVFFTLLIIVVLQVVFFFVDFSTNTPSKISNNQLLTFEKEFDSLQKLIYSKFELKPFNPNYISDFKGYQLGMSTDEIDKLLLHRKRGKFVNSKLEFQNITGVSDSLLIKIAPYFKFPDWVISKNNLNKKLPNPNKVNLAIKKDINKAGIEELKKVRGIGEKLSNRIINYRKKLQGFSYNNQLLEVWGLEKNVVNNLLLNFEVKSKPQIKKVNINEASFKELLAIVYIDYDLTKKIVLYRNEVAEIQSIDELKKIDGFPLEKFNRIALYLCAK